MAPLSFSVKKAGPEIHNKGDPRIEKVMSAAKECTLQIGRFPPYVHLGAPFAPFAPFESVMLQSGALADVGLITNCRAGGQVHSPGAVRTRFGRHRRQVSRHRRHGHARAMPTT